MAEEDVISLTLNTGRITRWLHSTAAMDPHRIVAPEHEMITVEEILGLSILTGRMTTSSQSPAVTALHQGVRVQLPNSPL